MMEKPIAGPNPATALSGMGSKMSTYNSIGAVQSLRWFGTNHAGSELIFLVHHPRTQYVCHLSPTTPRQVVAIFLDPSLSTKSFSKVKCLGAIR